ncbi:MAG: hypothetical protein SFY96_06185 [Planctomycetota bacterium]|nr:hypothetical protein [Planctomycetota bacterium]
MGTEAGVVEQAEVTPTLPGPSCETHMVTWMIFKRTLFVATMLVTLVLWATIPIRAAEFLLPHVLLVGKIFTLDALASPVYLMYLLTLVAIPAIAIVSVVRGSISRVLVFHWCVLTNALCAFFVTMSSSDVDGDGSRREYDFFSSMYSRLAWWVIFLTLWLSIAKFIGWLNEAQRGVPPHTPESS